MITSFSGEYRFLSNFWMHPVSYEGVLYPSNEHAFVAAKTEVLELRKLILHAPSPGTAKRIGRDLILRDNWEQLKTVVMHNLIKEKFSDPKLRALLDKTAPQKLIEGNSWGDVYWGECPLGTGKNMLGKLLMYERDGLFL